MNYDEALEYIHGTLKFGVKLGLHNIQLLLELMDNPHHKLKAIHIAGTNGKGSTTAFISSMLIEAGYRTGIFTSPYLERFTERIKIDRDEIQKEDLARITSYVKEKVDLMINMGSNHPTEFEIITAIAFQYFYEMKCDLIVLETGLGGRFDSTNIIDTSLVSVITTISYDHMNILGNTLSEIAYEKAGIIKEDGDVVLYSQSCEAEKVFADVSRKKSSTIHKVSFDSVRINNFSVTGQGFDYDNLRDIHISLLGEHQVRNAVVALECIRVLNRKGYLISESAIRTGLSAARWPGRLEVLKHKPIFLIDGAHNREGVQVLTNFLKEYFPGKEILFIVGVLKDKDYRSFIELCAPIATSFWTVTPKSDRALPAQTLAHVIEPYCKNVIANDTIEEAIASCLNAVQDESVICAFGSLYYIGEIRNIFKSFDNATGI